MRVDVAVGTVVAGYRLDRLIGEGATGAVYSATRRSDGGRVALKVLAAALARDHRYRRRFLRESEIASKLAHENIVKVVDGGDDAGTLYLAMDYIEGSTLGELLKRERRLEVGRTLALLNQIAAGLDAAHRAGLVHRDVKPENVLVTPGPDGEHAYVCDFGLARRYEGTDSLTRERAFVGTLDYAAPEQIEGEAIDRRTDVYALGCMLFACLTGAPPFSRDSELALLFAHLNADPPRLSQLLPGLPVPLDAVAAKALAKSPSDRYESCGAFVDAAGAAFREERRPRRVVRAPVAAAAAAMVAAAIAVPTLLTVGRGPNAAPPKPQITAVSIAGARLGRMPAYYRSVLGGNRAAELTDFHLPSLAFQLRQVAVYFPDQGEPADVITTWNREHKTAAGIGPCSSLSDMRRAYGTRLHPTHAGHTGTVQWSWALGDNLLFVTQDHRTVAAVVLYDGGGHPDGAFGSEAWANYIGVSEIACR
jgi:predicted Ser/Thr protein kinase